MDFQPYQVTYHGTYRYYHGSVFLAEQDQKQGHRDRLVLRDVDGEIVMSNARRSSVRPLTHDRRLLMDIAKLMPTDQWSLTKAVTDRIVDMLTDAGYLS